MVNRYDNPAQAEFINTYVPIPFEQLYTLGKQAKENVTKTEIIPLSKENSIHELARLLGGDKMTASILESAKEMKELAMSEI